MRLKAFLAFSMTALFITACAHRPKLVEISEVEQTAQSRAPASKEAADDMPEENFEADLQAILHSQTAASDLLDHVDRLVRLHERAQDDLATFDDELDDAIASKSKKTPVTDRSNKTYSRLVTFMMMTHVQRDEIAYIYARLLDITQDGSTEEKTVASQVIGELKRKARSLKKTERVFLQDLMRQLADIQTAFTKTSAEKDSAFDETLFADVAELNDFYADNRNEINKEITQATADGDPQVEKFTDRMHMILNTSGMRSPQSVSIEPGFGATGNLTGREFPTGAWAFTFDDGPSAKYTPHILDNLDANGIKATFFWLAQNTKLAGTHECVERALNEGMQPQCHSYTHANLAKAGTILINKEIIQAVTEERQEYAAIEPGYKIEFFRCPYGSCLHNQAVRQALVNEKLIHAFWNVDTLDWQDHNPTSILARAQKQMAVQKRGIILMHDIHPQSVIASGLLMKAVKADAHLRTVTLPQMVDELNH